jgi:chloride channel protein, CIC family
VGIVASVTGSRILNHPLLRKYTSLVNEDLTATYSRDIQKWLIIAPIIGVLTGLLITGIAILVLDTIWAAVLPYYLAHHWAIVAGLAAGFIATGLIMQFLTPDPNQHSTEEIISSYHEHQGDIDMRPFWWKLLAAVTTVGTGGSAALEGPSIYGGGAIGSWLWTKARRFGLESRDRRIMMIAGAGAGMAAVFRAPLTGIVFALEMPYKDDLAHEALLPSLIASVVAYATLAAIVGTTPLFGFVGSTSFEAIDVFWSAVLGLVIGLVALVFDITFRRVRTMFVRADVAHTYKMLIGGLGTAICGLAFISIYPGKLIPIGPNYEAVSYVLSHRVPAVTLVVFAGFKLVATIFSLGSGGVSAMFVPLILVGASIGSAFAQSIVHTPTYDLYAAVGMASLIASGYKTPLTSVVFVAEVTGGHSFIIPSLIGAAVAYAVSGEASVSGDQHLHEMIRIADLGTATVSDVMHRQVVSTQADATLADVVSRVAAVHKHTIFPVYEEGHAAGVISMAQIASVPSDKWAETRVRQVADLEPTRVATDCDLNEALRLLVGERPSQMLLVMNDDGSLAGIVTKTDVLRAVQSGGLADHRMHFEAPVDKGSRL